MAIESNLEELTITGEMVEHFRKATKDENKVHDRQKVGESAIALGFQIGALMQNYSIRSITKTYKDMVCQDQRTFFKDSVTIGSKVKLTLENVEEEMPYIFLDVSMKINQQEAATARLTYTNKRISRVFPTQNKTIKYTLNESDAKDVAEGLGLRGMKDFGTLALGLSSNALYAMGKEIVDIAEKSNKRPVYVRHKMNFYEPFSSLGPNDEIQIKVDIKRIIVDGRSSVSVDAMKGDCLVYSADFILAFVQKAK